MPRLAPTQSAPTVFIQKRANETRGTWATAHGNGFSISRRRMHLHTRNGKTKRDLMPTPGGPTQKCPNGLHSKACSMRQGGQGRTLMGNGFPQSIKPKRRTTPRARVRYRGCAHATRHVDRVLRTSTMHWFGKDEPLYAVHYTTKCVGDEALIDLAK